MNSQMLAGFRNPDSMLRGAPFWAWNCRLDTDELLRQIDIFAEMGIGGFHMHARTGLDTEYLSDEFMAKVRACCEHAARKGMRAWLYDEDRWPSGGAGGLVTCDPAYRARYLLFTPTAYGQSRQGGNAVDSRASGGRTEEGQLLGGYAVRLDANGCLAAYRRVDAATYSAAADETMWYAYREVSAPSSWFNNEAYVDTLNPAAIARFVEVTHQRYLEKVGEYFGNTVPAIFTDEPQFTHKGQLGRAADKRDITMPFTDDFPESFHAAYGGDILDYLPELFWELPDGHASVWRYRYHDHVSERFAAAFADTVGNWCQANGIALTGHMMEEPSLSSQTAALGEAMRSYRSFQIPGIDVLCDWMESEYNTAKQAQSAAHQFGCSGVLSELYGVTNWTFDFAGHKRQGDWQAALGVLYRVHHLTWVSMAGEAKRDYPASIGYQSPWYSEYAVVEDHFARVGSVLSRGEPVVRIGVIHPVESFWLCWGPLEQTLAQRQQRDQKFSDLTRWLLYDFADFDFISESLLPQQNSGDGSSAGSGFAVGRMRYDVVLVPSMRTMRASTLARLQEFAAAGGKLIFVGEVPSLVDALPSPAVQQLAARCQQIAFDRIDLLTSLSAYHDVRLLTGTGVQAHGFVHQLRREADELYLFICNTSKENPCYGLSICITGNWQVTQLDSATGETTAIGALYREGQTVVPWDCPAHGSRLLSLTPGKSQLPLAAAPQFGEVARLQDPVPVTLSEPNVLLLDSAECRIGNNNWQPCRHILQWDPIVRAELGAPPVDGHMAQPWTDREPLQVLAEVRLRFTINSEVDVAAPQLALENAATSTIYLDGCPVAKNITGYFTDKAIQTVALPAITAGEHILEVAVAYTRKTYLEWCYLLGDFGVRVVGRDATITAPVRQLAFADWTQQGLPFYGGNVTFHCQLTADGRPTAVRVPHFAGPLVKAVLADGSKALPLPFAPFRAELGALAAGEHQLDLTVFGNRANCFGQVHNMAGRKDANYKWWGPGSWRTQGDGWVDQYLLYPMGLLGAPIVEVQS